MQPFKKGDVLVAKGVTGGKQEGEPQTRKLLNSTVRYVSILLAPKSVATMV
jgi:hypothetical protein